MARFYKYDADKDGFWSKAEFCVWLPGDEPGGRRHKSIIKKGRGTLWLLDMAMENFIFIEHL